MGKARLEAFSDGVLAIIITIMVLELKVPHSEELGALFKLWPVFLSYVLSFIFVAIYWVNHHHVLHTVHQVSARILWANVHLLFWLSLVPFTTGWMGENHFASMPTLVYGVNLLCAGFGYKILTTAIISTHGEDSVLKKAIGKNHKGNLSLLMYAIAIPLALVLPALSWCLYVGVALIWLVPDKRIEKAIHQANH